MHHHPSIPFNTNAHNFNSALNQVGFGFGGSGVGFGTCPGPPAQKPGQTAFGFGFGSGSGSVGDSNAQNGVGSTVNAGSGLVNKSIGFGTMGGNTTRFGMTNHHQSQSTSKPGFLNRPSSSSSSSSSNQNQTTQGNTIRTEPTNSMIHPLRSLSTNPNPITRKSKRQRSPSPSPSPSSSSHADPHNTDSSPNPNPNTQEENTDDLMSLSQTPRPKRARPTASSSLTGGHERKKGKDDLTATDEADQEAMDLGVLLASLPPRTHLQILSSLLQSHPSLKPAILRLVPVPEVEDMMILLKDVLGEVRARVPIMGTYGQGQGQRDVGLVGVRVGGEVQRFAMVVTTFLNRFLATSLETGSNASSSSSSTTTMTMTTAVAKTTNPPLFLLPLTHLILTSLLPLLPPTLKLLTHAGMEQLELVLQRVINCWDSWVTEIGRYVNEQGGMFPIGTVRSWVQGMDELVHLSSVLNDRIDPDLLPDLEGGSAGDLDRARSRKKVVADITIGFGTGLRRMRDEWIGKCGWLVGREGTGDELGGDFRMG